MRIGIHVRVSGGYAKAVDYARTIGCNALQIFSSNPRSYRPAKIDVPALQNFASLRKAAGIDPCVIHTPYLINLASDDPKKYQGSLALLRADLATAAAGGIAYVNTHLGSYGERDRNDGFASVVAALETVLADITPNVYLVLENSAGAGNLAGGTIEELGSYLDAVDHPQLGVCLDTAHAWAAGYAINTAEGVDRFVDLAEKHIGLNRLHLFHFNDTEVPLGGARDRHFHIGEGLIGYDGFRALLAHRELQAKTAILETPGEEEDDIRNMNAVLTLERAALAR